MDKYIHIESKLFNDWFEFINVMKDKVYADPPLRLLFVLQYKCLTCSKVVFEVNTKACDHLTCVLCTSVEIRYCNNSDCILPLSSFYDISEEEFNRMSKIEFCDIEYLIYNTIMPGIGGIILTNVYQKPSGPY